MMDGDGVIEIEDQDQEEYEDEEDEDDEEEDDDEDYEEEESALAEMGSPRVFNSITHAGTSQGEVVVIEEGLVNDLKSHKRKLGSQENCGNDAEGDDVLNRGEIDGLFCPICFEAYTSGGDHKICCLPCGHIYGLSCINKWLKQRRSSGKCPQCNRKCTLKDVRVHYHDEARLCVVDTEKVRSLEAKCAFLEQKVYDILSGWCLLNAHHTDFSTVPSLSLFHCNFCYHLCVFSEQSAHCCKEAKLEVHRLTQENRHLKNLLEDRERELRCSFPGSQGYQRGVVNGHGFDSGYGSQARSGIFILQSEFQVDGGRFFDMDASGELIIVARRLNGIGGTNVLTKISLLAPAEREDIQLPANTKAVRDLCVKPHSRLALLASIGKKLSVVSTESNNTVLSYDLPAPAWSCSWDINSSHHLYTGLQNGMLLAFDMRQTRGPMESRTGLSYNPVHTVVSVAPDSTLPSGTRTLLTASQIGLCEWNLGISEERPYLIPETDNQGVCISLAYSGSDDIVASFRPKIEMSGELSVYQPSPTPSISSMDDGRVQGSHVFYKIRGSQTYQKTGSTVSQVASVRLPKSRMINKQNQSPMFASVNEVACELVLHDVSTFSVLQRLKTPKNQIWDVRCMEIWNSCLLGCLSGDTLQLFS